MSAGATKASLIINVSVALFFAIALIIAPIAVDQIHMDDSLLLANVGWRGVNGLAPVIDYPHFYGGFAESFVIASFQAFGVSLKTLDYAFVMLFAAAAPVIWLLCWKRLRSVDISLLTAIAAVLIVSLNPLESHENFSPAHSFVYNHVGIVLMLALTVFACRVIEDRRLEFAAAFAAGGALYALVLLKTTFGLFGLSVLLICLIQRRWSSVGLMLAGAILVLLLLDPTLARALGSLQLLMTSGAASQAGGIDGRMFIASLMLQTQAVPIAIVLIMTIVLWRREKRDSLPLIASLLICGAGYSAAMLSTGGSPQYKLLPFLVVAALLLCKSLTAPRVDVPDVKHRALITAVPIVLAYLLIVPAVATSAIALSSAFKNAGASLVEQGPLSEYVVFDPAVPDHAGSASERLAAATATTIARVRAGQVSDREEYVMLADGVALLRKFDNVSALGIVSNGRMFDFTAPLQARVVKSFPVWPTAESPELMLRTPLEADVDIVMMLEEIPELELVSGALRTRMGQEFRPCLRSAFWTLYVRRNVPTAPCATIAAQRSALVRPL